MKRLPYLATVLLLAGCAHDTAPQNAAVEAPATPPRGMFKLLETDELVTYFDAHSVALYQGNASLRQFALINNYRRTTTDSSEPRPIQSTRTVRVINCEQDQVAQFGRVYFSQPFALGQQVASKPDTPKWEKLQQQSVLYTLRDMVCKIDAARLRPGDSQ